MIWEDLCKPTPDRGQTSPKVGVFYLGCVHLLHQLDVIARLTLPYQLLEFILVDELGARMAETHHPHPGADPRARQQGILLRVLPAPPLKIPRPSDLTCLINS